MDKSLEEKISGILSSPDELKKIMSIASSLGLGKSEPIEAEATEKGEEVAISENSEKEIPEKSVLEKLLSSGRSERAGLLNALKPYLKNGKREKLESLLRILNAVEILISAKDIL